MRSTESVTPDELLQPIATTATLSTSELLILIPDIAGHPGGQRDRGRLARNCPWAVGVLHENQNATHNPTPKSMTPSSEAAPERNVRTARERTSPVLERNIRALAELDAEQQRPKSGGDRFAMAISRFAGSMRFVYFHAFVFGLWAAMDLGYIPGISRVDPQLIGLNTVATIEAIFLATFVLIAQNRMSVNAETRNRLDVHVSLLTEQETTHILRLVSAMSEKMGLADAADPEVQQFLRMVEPQEMIDQIEVEIDAAEGNATA